MTSKAQSRVVQISNDQLKAAVTALHNRDAKEMADARREGKTSFRHDNPEELDEVKAVLASFLEASLC